VVDEEEVRAVPEALDLVHVLDGVAPGGEDLALSLGQRAVAHRRVAGEIAQALEAHAPAPSVSLGLHVRRAGIMAPVRFPVHHVDRFFLMFESPPPVACAWVFAVDGDAPDPERLRAAVARMLREHPRADVRWRRDRGRWEWETLDGDGGRACVFEPPLEGPDENAAEGERVGRLMAAPLDPAEGPLVRVHWIAPGAFPGRLVLRFHHALTDGAGSLALVRSLLEAYDGLPPTAAPAAPFAGEPLPAPLVAGGAGRKARLLSRLLWLHARRSGHHRFALPETLFRSGARPSGGLGVAGIRVAAERRRDLGAAVRGAGVGLPDLVLAAAALAAERALAAEGRTCGMLRIQVTQDLRRGRGAPALENRSSAFPIWIGPADRRAGAGLVRLVHRQMRECLRTRAAEGTALFAAALRLPPAIARRLLLPMAAQPRIADSLIVTWLGALPPSEPGAEWFRLGRSVFRGARAVVRPAEGVGALLTGVELNGHLALTLSTLDGLFSRAEAERYLALVDAALDELASALRAG
jgi:hypothetical protein